MALKKASPASDVPEYIATAPKETRAQLRELRKLVKAAVPKADEIVSYGMPYYKYKGRPLTGFAPFKAHIGVFALPVHGNMEVKPYVHAKGTVHLPIGEEMPTALLTKLLKERAKLIDAGKK
jgi:uncharacterized protein YdhG (YjbR/CyaY superfamily)